MSLEAWPSLVANSQEVSLLVPLYLDQWTRYRSSQLCHWWSILESRISKILYSGSLSTLIRGGGDCTQFGIMFGMEGSSWETWNMGWMEFMESGSWSIKEWEPACAMIVYGPRFFSESFFEGHVEWRYLALTNTWSPTLKSGAGVHQASTGTWYHCWVWAISSQRNSRRESRSMEYSWAWAEVRLCSRWMVRLGW